MLNESPAGRFPAVPVRGVHRRASWQGLLSRGLGSLRTLTALLLRCRVRISALPWSAEFITLWNHARTGIGMDVLLSEGFLLSEGREKEKNYLFSKAQKKGGSQHLRELFSSSGYS